jgi:hypothetical protein
MEVLLAILVVLLVATAVVGAVRIEVRHAALAGPAQLDGPDDA